VPRAPSPRARRAARPALKTASGVSEQPQTWHHGLMAEWWARWTTEGRAELPRPWGDEPRPPVRTRWFRVFALEPDARGRSARPVDQHRDADREAARRRAIGEAERPLSMRMWFRDELVLMLRTGGFRGGDGARRRPGRGAAARTRLPRLPGAEIGRANAASTIAA
jgi:hypothetical protein